MTRVLSYDVYCQHMLYRCYRQVCLSVLCRLSSYASRLHWRIDLVVVDIASTGKIVFNHCAYPVFFKSGTFSLAWYPCCRGLEFRLATSHCGGGECRLYSCVGLSFYIGYPTLIHCLQADSDDVTAIDALLAGMKLHFERTGKAASLIHTVSTSNHYR